MLAERLLTKTVKLITNRRLALYPCKETMMPAPKSGVSYMVYLHVPFCQVLCPYCSFNRYPFHEDLARPYFKNLRKELLMLKDLGYNLESMYFGGGTPTILIEELCETIDLARSTFNISEVCVETNPNHLADSYLDMLQGRVNRVSVGVQSFNNDLLKQMDRYWKYGSGEEIFERLVHAAPYFDEINVDMIFNFPSQSRDVLEADLQKIIECGCQQVTFSPLYISDATTSSMEKKLGKMNYPREFSYYDLIDSTLVADEGAFERNTVWTFKRKGTGSKNKIDEYMVFYEEYPSIGSGSITNLDGNIYVNTFSLKEYNDLIESGRMSLTGKCRLSKKDLMRYRFLVELYRLRLDVRAFKHDFGCSPTQGLPLEMAFMRANRAFATDNNEELTLTKRGRYLTLVMYRQFLSAMNNLRDQSRAQLTGPERELLFEHTLNKQ